MTQVDLQGIERVCSEFDAIAVNDPQAAVFHLSANLPPELARVRRKLCRIPAARLRPVAIDGDRDAGMRMGWFETPLRDGTVGYLQRRLDDCVQAALASLLQVAPHTIPDFRFDARLMAGTDLEEVELSNEELLWRWAAENGVEIRIHATPPVTERRWIGVASGHGPGGDHCLIMSRRDFLFDPANQQPWEPNGAIFSPDDVDWAITVERQ